ncbi:MAG: glycosyltransferase [Bacteroidetes bacterium]|nr:glycosyltransferase [Bacteroidota bacterium]
MIKMIVFDIYSIGFWVASSFAFVALCQILIYLFLYFKIARYKNPNPSTEQPPVSIIICAKNEADNLIEFLPKILSQEYPLFEIVVVNDCSSDNTEDILREYAKLFPNLHIITIKEDEYYKHGKKLALMIGIKGAKYEHLLFTDGDCYPDSIHWISEMMQQYTPETEIVIGYGPYRYEKSFLNKLIRFDTFYIGLQYLSLALANKPYMGVGRNLSYKKNLFFKNKGFSKHYHIQSGDDDLFINQNATRQNVKVALNTNSFTYSISAKNIAEWSRQKSRHLTTAPLYSTSSKNRLALLHATTYSFYILFITSLFFVAMLPLTLIVFLIKNLVQMFVYHKLTKKLGEKELLAGFLLYECILLFLYPIWHLQKRGLNAKQWKT